MHPWWLKLRSGMEPMFGFKSQPPLALFTAWFTYFIASQYFIESSFIYRAGFYVTLLVFIALWVRQSAHVYAVPRNIGSRGLVVLALFVIFHALVISHGVDASKTLRDLATNAVFVGMCLVMFRQEDARWDRFFQWMLVVMAVCAAISLAWFALDPDIRPYARLTTIGRHENPLLGANMYGVALMIALATYYRHDQKNWLRNVALLLILLVPVITVLSQSRGPMVAQLVGFGLALLLFRRYRLFAALALLAIAAGLTLLYAPLPALAPLQAKLHMLLFARDPMRLQIWQYTLTLIEQRPWTGYGLRNIFVMPTAPTVVNPHNLFVSSAYYTGWPGLAILLVPLIAAFVYAIRDRSWHGKLCLLLLVHGVVALSTDGGQAIKSPSPLWTLYWLPIAMALTRPQKVSVGQA